MVLGPEDRARRDIDALLKQAGWIIQNPDEMHLGAGIGVAVRELHLTTGDADYGLYINRQLIGAIEAKRKGFSLAGVEAQTAKYSHGIPEKLPAPIRPLPFLYESTGVETFFTNLLDPVPRSRRIFAFHRPETLADWLGQHQRNEGTTRRRFREYPPLIENNLWNAQVEAIRNLEVSIAQDRPRALIQMATGAGKTFAAVNFIYRMLRYGRVQRVLFLVDRRNLGKQAKKEFHNFETPDDGRKFTELYNVQLLQSNGLDSVAKVVITTVQRLYSMLRNDPDFDIEDEETSMFDNSALTTGDPREVVYNPAVPIEFFDIIVVDECHRSIYNLWRQVLEYFDAHIIGLTATPSMQTFGFFNQNLVMEYTRARAIADGVNVGSRLYVIRTRITQDGSTIEADGETYIPKLDKRTRERRMELLDNDLDYDANELDMKVVSPSQIRTVIRTFRDHTLPEMFPNRAYVPKTLIFAKDDSHAEDIVRIVREEFDRGNDFCKKITYRVTGVKPDDLIVEFRTQHNPRIVVTVDMIATGTDIKPIEILLFMRAVRSAGLYEQMQGRGTRVIDVNDLRIVSPDAFEKDFFLIVDAVGVIDIPKTETLTLERRPSVSLSALLDDLAAGNTDDDTFLTLAGRLARMSTRRFSDNDRARLASVNQGYSLQDLANQLLHATDYDAQTEVAQQTFDTDQPTYDQIEQVALQMKYAVADLFSPPLRALLKEIHERQEIYIDEMSRDEVLMAHAVDLGENEAAQTVNVFQDFIETHLDEITALQILYNIPYRTQRLEWAHIKELSQRLEQPPYRLTPEKLWQAYAKVQPESVRATETKRVLTDLIALVRHVLHPEQELIPFTDQAYTRYERWLQEKARQGWLFTDSQRDWLDAIAQYISMNLFLDAKDFNDAFYDLGGIQAAVSFFDGIENITVLLNELNTVMVA
ncbi:MAG: DEAD/DEAH box helicase family protein [Anaerolineales bacterium]|nr:DEAD/DEAH box helicase family protein [Anaerolineales bacterium]